MKVSFRTTSTKRWPIPAGSALPCLRWLAAPASVTPKRDHDAGGRRVRWRDERRFQHPRPGIPADLKGQPVAERTRRLIAIAIPPSQEDLARQARD
jgi:hypothetical protein